MLERPTMDQHVVYCFLGKAEAEDRKIFGRVVACGCPLHETVRQSGPGRLLADLAISQVKTDQRLQQGDIEGRERRYKLMTAWAMVASDRSAFGA
jgi:hypothetical protein